MSELNENESQADMVLHPGETLLEMLLERNMTQAELAERMGRPLKTINEIIKGKKAITTDTAIQLERVFNVKADFWNQLEINYRSFLARLKEDQRLLGHDGWLKEHAFPIKEMIDRGWIPDVGKNILLQVRELLNFYSVASQNEWKNIWSARELAFRRSDIVETKTGPTTVWLRQGEIEAGKINCKDFDESALKSSLAKLRSLTLEPKPEKFVEEIIKICSAAGVAVVFLPTFKGVPISGVSHWLTSKKAMILLSLRYKTDDHLWFTLFHELAHIILHKKKNMFVEFSKKPNIESEYELEADKFSAETLIPEEKLKKWLAENVQISEWAVLSFAKDLGISPGIVVGRLQHIKKLPHSFLNSLKKTYKWCEDTH